MSKLPNAVRGAAPSADVPHPGYLLLRVPFRRRGSMDNVSVKEGPIMIKEIILGSGSDPSPQTTARTCHSCWRNCWRNYCYR